MPKRVRFNTLGRTTYIVVVGVFVIYNACFDLPLYGSAARFYDCTPNNGYFPVTDEYFPACAIHRTWTTVAIVATCLAIIEAFYTLFKGPMEHAHFAKDSYTISSPHHPCGIQPNMTIPYGEPQPQPQPQPQRLPYQQPIYPIPHQPPQQPFAVMQPAGTSAGAAVSF
ncbi:hypothetical protein BGZ73_001554 [Actinomortierella ambigua]|nr:hypothetical protein BGZ73_001554 [Actinomortierella ambigua]